MRKNTLTILGILSLLLVSLAMSSAYTSTQGGVKVQILQELPNPVSPGNSHNIIVNVLNNNGDTITLNWTDNSATSGITSSLNFTGNDTISNGSSKNYTMTYVIPSSFNGEVSHKVKLNIYNSTNTIAIFQPYSIAKYGSSSSTKSYCERDYPSTGEQGLKLELELDITNNGKGDSDEWQYLDEIKIDVTVVNDDNNDVDDMTIELMILDEDNKVVSRKDIGLDKDKDDIGDVKDDDEETATFKIDKVPVDMDDGKYYLYAMAYSDGDEEHFCVSKSDDYSNSADTYYEFSIEAGEDSSVIPESDIKNVKASCGDKNVAVKFIVYNIGDDDQDKVLVTLENEKLGIDEKYVINGLRDGKSKEITFHVDVPDHTNETLAKLEIYTYYNYDDDEKEDSEFAYDDSSKKEGDDFEVYLEIIACELPSPTIRANLNSVAKVGEDLVVNVHVLNNGNKETFVISASDHEWANLVSIKPQTLTIDKNETKEALVILSPTQSGAQTFKIEVLIDGKAYEKTLSVNITKKDNFLPELDGIMLYMAIAAAILLIIIFIILIMKKEKRKVVNF